MNKADVNVHIASFRQGGLPLFTSQLAFHDLGSLMPPPQNVSKGKSELVHALWVKGDSFWWVFIFTLFISFFKLRYSFS